MLRRVIPLVILSASGLILILSYFSPMTESLSETVVSWFNILAGVAFVLGAGNLLAVNLEKISSRRPGWGYAAITLVSFCAMLVAGFVKWGAVPNPEHPNVHLAGSQDSTQAAYGWAYEYVLSPLTATMFGLLAFYVASAAFRAFRAKNFEAILLLSTAFIILLVQIALGAMLTDWIPENSAFAFLRAESIKAIVTETFQTAGMRAIMIGIALGTAATSLRLILGIDRAALAKD